MQAANVHNLAIVKLLLESGADANRCGVDGESALHIAVDISIDGTTIQRGGRPGDEPPEIIECLLKYGANINSVNVRGKSPLDWDSSYGSKKIVNLLISD
jgi:ankyrin repeat protein